MAAVVVGAVSWARFQLLSIITNMRWPEFQFVTGSSIYLNCIFDHDLAVFSLSNSQREAIGFCSSWYCPVLSCSHSVA